MRSEMLKVGTMFRWTGVATLALMLASNACAADRVTQGALQFIAGSIDGRDAVDGVGAAARFADNEVGKTLNRSGIAVDKDGNVFVADLGNQIIRKVTPAGVVTTVAGSARMRGSADGPAAQARFNDPAGIALDVNGNLYVCDSGNHSVRKISPSGDVTTLAGNPSAAGFSDGAGQAARFKDPQGIAIDAAGNAYVADVSNYVIRRITPQGVVTTFAGNPQRFADKDGRTQAAQLNYPFALAFDPAGNLYVTQLYGGAIRKISPEGDVTTPPTIVAQGSWGEPTGSTALWEGASGVVVGADGNVFVANTKSDQIRRISASGIVSNVAGHVGRGEASGDQDGPAFDARFHEPAGIALDQSGSVFVFDAGNATLRKIDPRGMVVSTVAGRARKRWFNRETWDGPPPMARFGFQTVLYASASLAADADQNIYVAEPQSHTIRRIDGGGNVTTIAGSPGKAGATDGAGAAARFSFPAGVVVDSKGNLFVADTNNCAVRKIDRMGIVSTFAGALGQPGNVDGRGADARFDRPRAIAIDHADNLYVSDLRNYTIRKIDARGSVTTLAGLTGAKGLRDGVGTAARFEEPADLSVDREGNVYVVDGELRRTIRRVSQEGRVTTPAINWKWPDTMPSSTRASPDVFRQLAFDDSGNLYFVDASRHVVWKVAATGEAQVIAGDPQWPALAIGPLPGHLDHPNGLTYLGRNQFAVTSGNSVLRIVLP